MAQKDLKMEALNRVIINRQDTIYQFYTAKPITGKPNLDSYYYWYKPDTILITQGGFDGKLLHGEYEVFYPNNNLLEKGQFTKGLKTGVWKNWFPGGNLKSIINWEQGRKQGRFDVFNEEGKKTSTGSYKRDRLTGHVIDYAGDSVVAKRLFRDGQPVKPKETKAKRKKSGPADASQK